MYKLNSMTKTSRNNNYNIINCKTEQIVGHLRQSIGGNWFYTNRELNIIDKRFITLPLAILAITN